ncbi:arsenite efflux ATP-binding protein ArsA [Salinicoccus halodurans]|uniref:Arsenite efflux ATP-binding protein ArsA n=1 Tax=Salinicoccus halodurans TaxID=407035 RepID=A0AA94HHF4_9STAP|nr:arsenite efflux ATP-binding protein ArsA [Salinicoccus halodurans]
MVETDVAKDMQKITPQSIELTKYLFFTGKGGVGKTTVSSALALNLAKANFKVALISTDPASNLQDVFNMELTNKLLQHPDYENLAIANFDPLTAAADYKENVVKPYEGILPEETLNNMKEQLSGSCTVEVAAFNEFTHFLSDEKIASYYDYIIFDTAPTGHTLRMLELPTAWNDYLDTTSHEASCLGQLSGLDDNRQKYKQALERLRDEKSTTMMLVTRPEHSAMKELQRAQDELKDLSIRHFKIIINGYIDSVHGEISRHKKYEQDVVIESFSEWLNGNEVYQVPYSGRINRTLADVGGLFDDTNDIEADTFVKEHHPMIEGLIEEIETSGVRYLFTMGKGGVGKTTVATLLAETLASKGYSVHLATTDPTKEIISTQNLANLVTSFIDEEASLQTYKAEVLSALGSDISQADIDYIEEDLRSPCTEEIAFFKAFSKVMENNDEADYIVVDTAPTGHTLLLLDSSESYHEELKKQGNHATDSVQTLLPKIQDQNLTQMIIVTLPEATPYYEASRLSDDLDRADIGHKWWVINQSLVTLDKKDKLFSNKKKDESKWIEMIKNRSENQYHLIPYKEK